MEASQCIQLLVVKLDPPAHSGLADVCEPVRPMPGGIDLLAGTGRRPTAIDRFHPIHHSAEILGDGQITARQFLQDSQAVVLLIARAQLFVGQ